MTESPVNFKHFPALDGLRGIAVLMVMCYHLERLIPELHPVVKGGFLGVDIFFVLSGFLITSILLQEFDQTGRIDLRNFYIRRSLRLMPAFWLFLIVLYFTAPFLLSHIEAPTIYEQNNFLYAFTYLLNWHRAIGGVTGNLNHTWSLAIEEQFYIIWSLLLITAFGESRSRKQIAVGTAIIILVLMLERGVRTGLGTSTDMLYYSTDTRIDAILIGCLASMVFCWRLIPHDFLRSRGFTIVFGLAFVSASVITASVTHQDRVLYFGVISVFSISVAIGMLWLITSQNTVFHRFLELAPLRWIGRVSYGLYLWHYLFYEFAKLTFDSAVVQVIFAVGLSLAVAALSYYSVEQPIMQSGRAWLKNRIARKLEPSTANG